MATKTANVTARIQPDIIISGKRSYLEVSQEY